MNTTAKGNLLEDQVYEILCRIKESGIYGKHTQIFKHKKYFYNPTQAYKVIDVVSFPFLYAVHIQLAYLCTSPPQLSFTGIKGYF